MSTKFKPILFSTEMVQAILEGRKTQTRRAKGLEKLNENSDDWILEDTWLTQCTDKIALFVFKRKDPKTCLENESFVNIDTFPYGNIGDIIWVRECYCIWDDGTFKYKTQSTCDTYGWRDTMIDKWIKWKPSIHMPKAACKLFLRIKDLRVERLKDISKEDALAEGVKEIEKDEAYFDYMKGAGTYAGPIGSFFSLWESINGAESVMENPWVWVIEFECVEKPTNF